MVQRTEFKDRLALAMRHANLDEHALAKGIEVSYQAVVKVLDGRSKSLSAINNSRAAKVARINSDWLATGEGDMLASPTQPTQTPADPVKPVDLATALPVVLEAVADLTPGQWRMVRARLDDLPGQPRTVLDVFNDVVPLLGVPTTRLQTLLEGAAVETGAFVKPKDKA